MILLKFILSHREHGVHRDVGLVSRRYELTKVIVQVSKVLVVGEGFVKELPT